MIVLSDNFVLSPAEAELSPDHPVIGWRNVVVAGSVAADTAAEGFPVSNLANPATHLDWRAADTTAQYLTVTTNEIDAIDYVAVAKHNFGSGEIAVTLEIFDGTDWNVAAGPIMPADNSPLLFRFAAQSVAQFRLALAEGAEAARVAVMYAGKLLVVERKVYVGHTPLPHGRKTSVVNNRSESGNFLGRIVLGEWRESVIPLSLISPDWYRAEMDPFLAVAQEVPFFFAWRPQSYPREVGFAWLVNDPVPVPVGPSNRLAFDLTVHGIA